MRPSPLFLKHILVASACAAALLPALAGAASYQHRVNLQGLVVIGAGQALEGLSVALATSLLPDAIVGVPYSVNLNQLLTVSGDAAYSGAGITWGVVSNSLPAGLYLTADGYVGGTPTAAGTGDIQVRASYKTAQGEQTYQVVSLPLTVALSSAALPGATVGSPYSYDFKTLVSSNDSTFTGDKASFSASGLPAGLSLAANGVLAGTPTVKNQAGSSFQVVATYKGKDGQQVYTLIVAGAALQARQVSLGNSHTCALTLSGGVKCWGNNSYGQLGNPAAAAKQAVPLDVTGLSSGVVSLSSGIYHTCALMDSGRVKCWGMDDYGQLGDDSALASKSAPIDVSGIVNAKAVAVGGYHTCALTTSDQMLCWGWNASGQLGNSGALARQGTPVLVTGLSSSISSISAGGSNTCAVTSSGGLKCWGNDGNGQLGDDEALVNKSVPVDVFGLTSGISKVSVGNGFTCALTTSGSVKCWGRDAQGQLGNDAELVQRAIPVDVYGLTTNVASIDTGSSHACALLKSGGVLCWGTAAAGQLGNGETGADKPTPDAVSGLTSGVASVSTGGAHTCAVMTSGGVKCWGLDSSGQLGNDTNLVNQATPVDVAQ